MGEAAKRGNAAVEDPSKLVADNDHLAGELAASMRREQELWEENQKLKDDISDYEIEMRSRSDAAEKLARELNTERMQRKEFETLATSLEKELAAAPHWVPAAEFVDDMKPCIVWSKKEKACEARYSARHGGWVICYTESSICDVTHVLVGLKPPVIERDVDPRGDGDIEEVTPDTDVKMSVEQMADAFDEMIEKTKQMDPIARPSNDPAGDAGDIERAMRRRLMQPFYGSEAEKLGATKYQLRDGETWFFELERRWLKTDEPMWIDADQYRLATGE